MPIQYIKFAETEAAPSGLGAFGLDLQLFIAQLVTFLIVLLVLRKFVFPKLVATLEKRRKALELSLEQAKQTEEALHKAQEKAEDIIKKARADADQSMREAQQRAQEVIAKAEAKGGEQAQRIIEDAKNQLQLEKQKLSDELRDELSGLVALATETVIGEKMTADKDQQLIKNALAGVKK